MNATTLRDLLQQVIDQRKSAGSPAAYRDLEQAVKDEEERSPRGLTLNRQTVSDIIRGTYTKEPYAGTIRAIAWLAEVPEDVAFTAAGKKPPGEPFADELPPGVDDLSRSERRAAIEMLRTLIALRQEINGYELSSTDTAPQQGTSSTSGKSKKSAGKVTDLNTRRKGSEPDRRPEWGKGGPPPKVEDADAASRRPKESDTDSDE